MNTRSGEKSKRRSQRMIRCMCLMLVSLLLLCVAIYFWNQNVFCADIFRTVNVIQKIQKEETSNGVSDSAYERLLSTQSIFNSNNHAEENVTPVQRIAFLKVHKTASATAQNVFLRFGEARKLMFVLAHTKGESGYLNVISYEHSITKTNIVPPPPGNHFDILCCHVIYNREAFASVMPKDTVYIGIVREPVLRFQSAIFYFMPNYITNISGKAPLSIYADKPMAFEPKIPSVSMTNNRMAVEFGFPIELFPGKSLNVSVNEINAYITKLDKEFQFIIITEKFDESMVMMKRILNWETRDVLYINKNVHQKENGDSKYTLSEKDKDKIRPFLYLDAALYSFAVEKFNKIAKEAGEDFVKEVENFKSVISDVKTFCANKTVEPMMIIPASKWYADFRVTHSDCKLYNMREKDMIQQQRLRMYGVGANKR